MIYQWIFTDFKCLMTPCELSEKPAHEGLLSIIGGVLVRSVPSPVNTVRDPGTSDEELFTILMQN